MEITKEIVTEVLQQFVNTFFGEPPEDTDERVWIAIEKAHKEAPKKTAYGGYHCARCDGYVSLKQNYCMNCGQHLKWEDE